MPDPTPHCPTEDSRRQVSAMVAFGIPQDKIAVILGISAPTLRKHYRAEIDIADAKAQSMVAKFLFSAATGEALRTGATHADCIRSAMFWMKTRAGWKETATHEITGRDGQDLVAPQNDLETARRVAFLLARAQHQLDKAGMRDQQGLVPGPTTIGFDPAEMTVIESPMRAAWEKLR